MRRFLISFLAVAILVCGSISVTCAAKPKPKPKPKPTPKSQPAPTVQLAGDNGVFGKVYSICKGSPLYFRLKSAEYTTDQVVIGKGIYTPKADQKLLVLHFTIQNPQKTEQHVSWDSLRFTAVDKMNTNHEFDTDWGDDSKQGGDDISRTSVDMHLKPAQTIDVCAPIVVPAKAIIPKLMVLPRTNDDGPVLRYDLTNDKNKVAPLKPPVADPDDKSGYTALETVPGVVGTAYPYANFDITVEKFEYTTDSISGEAPEEGGRYLMVTLLMKNESHSVQYLFWEAVSPILTTADGEELTYKDMLFASTKRSISQEIKGHAEARVQIYFAVPQDVTPQKLVLKEGDSRTYEFAVQ